MPSHSVFSRISLFSYSNLVRINGEEFINNSYGGILTLIVLGVLMLISVLKVKEMFQKTSIVAKQSSTINVIPPFINITTIKGNSKDIPYMFGLGLYQDSFFTSSSTVTAEYVQVQRAFDSAKRTIKKTQIKLQNCTTSHFSEIANIEQNAKLWGIAGWLCLPMNLTLELGGSFQLTDVYKRLQVNINLNITCDTAQNNQDCGRVILYTLSRFVNPSGQKPSTYYLAQDQFQVKVQQSYTYMSRISMNHLNVDDSFMPTPTITTTSGISTEPSYIKEVTTIAYIFQTQIYIQMGNKEITYNRSYMKVVGVISFMGGIFNAILAAGIILSGFNRYFFQIKFAKKYFHISSKQNATLTDYFKTNFYGIFKGTPLQPKSAAWQPFKQQREMITAVNKMLDVININKRIVFLEQALGLIFERHQLKGLHLLNPITFEEAEQRIANHQLRQRLLYFLFKERNKPPESIESPTLPKSCQQLQKKTKKQTNFNQNLKQKDTKKHKYEANRGDIIDLSTEKNQIIERYPVESILESNQINSIDNLKPSTSHEITMSVQQQVEQMGEMAEQILKKDELISEIESDLKRFIEQAKTGINPASNQIYSRIDSQIKAKLQHLVREKQKGKEKQEEKEKEKRKGKEKEREKGKEKEKESKENEIPNKKPVKRLSLF